MTVTIATTTGAGIEATSNEEIIIVPEDVVLGDDNASPEIEVDGFNDVRIVVPGTIVNNDGGNQAPIYVAAGTTGTQITIEETGHVSGETAIRSIDEDVAVSNYGVIESLDGTGLNLGGASSVVNHGSISADAIGNFATTAVNFGEGDGAELVNYGTISARYVGVETNGDNVRIQNFGVISARERAAIDLRGETSGHIVLNSGVVSSTNLGIYSFANDTFISNTGEITGSLGLQYNSGTFADITQSEVQNSGTIIGTEAEAIHVGEGDITISNSGLISGAMRGIEAFVGSSGALNLINSGTIESRNLSQAVYSEDGDDMILNTGQIIGDVRMGTGEDTFITNGAGLTTGDVLLETGDDIAIGGASSDRISGGSDDDVIYGGGGVDVLEGGDDDDIILGGTGTDTITGGQGSDFLLGEDGADVFLFTESTDSGAVAPDSILDFERGEDIIDFYTITETLQFIGEDSFSVSGQDEIRVREIGGVLTVAEVDLGGNGTIDMEIIIYGAVDMDRADFGL